MSVTLRPTSRPLGRQPFRPGQWQGAKIGTKHTTYIQNNFFGSGYGTGFNYGSYSNYGSYCNHDDGGMSKGMKWMLGLGVGTTLLGGILKLFGVGGKDEAGAVQEEPNQPEIKQEAPNNDKVVKKANTEVETPETVAEEITSGKPEEKTDTGFNWNDLSNMVCRDASGKTQNISGSFNITQAGAEGEPPQEFTITDTSSGTPHTYTYELTGKSSDGKPIYTCKSMNGMTAQANKYTLEMNDGKPELVQYSNQDNYSTGLKFGSISNQNTPPAAKQTFEKTITINTSAGPTEITVKANSQEELDKKVAEEQENSKQWQGVTDQINGKQNTPTFSNPWGSFGTASTPHPTNTSDNKQQTFTKTIEVQTSVGPTTVTITANSQEELDKKVAEEEEKSKQWKQNDYTNPWG